MSVDSPTSAVEDPSEVETCSLCRDGLGEDGRFVTCYPAAEELTPERTADDGVLAVCGGCADEVDELLDAWTGHDVPPVDAAWSIRDGYRKATDDCSFCGRPLGDGSIVGVEYYRHEAAYSDAVDPRANYSLCESCAPVFDEFLDQIERD